MKYFKMQWNSVCEGNPERIRDYFRHSWIGLKLWAHRGAMAYIHGGGCDVTFLLLGLIFLWTEENITGRPPAVFI
ncbi:MAG: hypothetical protein ACOC36_05975, partial [Fibrobacterota bacterium]